MALFFIGYHHTNPGAALIIVASVTMVILHSMPGTEAGSLYTIRPPPVYTLFMGNLEINYTIPGNVSLPHAYVSLAFVGKDGKEQAPIASMGLLLGKKSGSLRVDCGYLVLVGRYHLKMHMRMKGEVLARANFEVRWPQISLSLPDDFEAQTRNVELWILSYATCSPFQDRQYLEVRILRFRGIMGQNATSIADGDVLYTKEYTSLTTVRTSMDLNCYIFDLDGTYQAVLMSTASDQHEVVSTSNVMRVTWSGQYQLTFQPEGIFPCSGNTTVVYTHPPCSGNDVIRMHTLEKKVSGSPASPLKRIYVTEKIADPARTKMIFDCSLFSKTASAFCFTYVSISKSGVYYEQRRLCVPAHPNSLFPLDGGWSSWSEWGSCTGTCGEGKKSRLRMCNNPAPKNGGRFCSGNPMEWRPCSHNCTEVIPLNPLYSPHIDAHCACGCVLTAVSGDLVASGRCPGSAVWTIKAEKEWIVSLTFGFFSLNYMRQKVTVRDGPSIYDQLLFSSNDHGYPVKVVSTGSLLRVELYTESHQPQTKDEFPVEATSSIHSHGFVAHYQCEAQDTGKIVPVLYQYEEKTILGSTVTIVGIVVCVVVIIAAIIFVVLQRTFFRDKIKYTTTSVGGSPALAIPLTQSDTHLANQHLPPRQARRHSYPHTDPTHISLSPHSSSNASSPGDGIFVDMEKPLTRKKGKGEKLSQSHRKSSKSSRTPSITSACSHTVKYFKSGAGGSGPLSPKPQTKDYITVKGPYGIEIVDTDEVPGPSRIKSPHSPHPVPQQRKSPSTPSSSTTKTDFLMKKRYDKSSDQSSSQMSDLERVVTGSSDGSSSQRSKTSTTKAQVNWPQGGFVRAALNEVGKSFADRNKRTNQRPPSEEIPLIDSNSQESPSHAINIMIKSDSSDSSASGLRSSKARRPTSLTESYSSDTPTTSKAKPIVKEHSPMISDKSDTGTLKTLDSVRPRPSPTTVTPTTRIQNFPTLPAPSPSSTRSPRVQHRPPVHQSYRQPTKSHSPCLARSTPTPGRDNSANDNPKVTLAVEEREALLPKPDGQSPKLPRVETPNLKTQRLQKRNELSSPGKLSKCSSRGSKTTVSSPTRSINTPSETEGLELEYDDFIEDDPLSYFDYEETQKLAFRGVEKIGRTTMEEEEEEDISKA